MRKPNTVNDQISAPARLAAPARISAPSEYLFSNKHPCFISRPCSNKRPLSWQKGGAYLVTKKLKRGAYLEQMKTITTTTFGYGSTIFLYYK